MREFLKEYSNSNPNKDRLNYGLINKTYDKPLIEYINDSAKSLEVIKNIEFLGSRFVEYESDIDMSKYERRRKSKDKKKNKQEIKYMSIDDSRVAELILKFRITYKGEVEIIEKPILIPMPDEYGYYQIKGKRYILMYQLVDASTYVNKNSVVLKSIMPIFMTRKAFSKKDTEGNEWTCPVFTTRVFKNDIVIMYFYFAKLGIKALNYFMVHQFVSFSEEKKDTENYIYFQISSGFYLKINREVFRESQYVRSVAFMILAICNTKVNATNINSKVFWIEKIGNIFSVSTNHYEKGKNILVFFDRMLDETTRSNLRIDPRYKRSMYSILLYMFQNFNELKKKDNMDMENKRLRDSEYITSLLNRELSKRILPVVNSGKKLSKEKIKDIFKFSGKILIDQLYNSGLFRYDDQVNDMDFFQKLKYTVKGPNSQGGQNSQSISSAIRGLHPSMIGRIDLNVVGTSDPGTGGVLTPFCETDGLYFSSKGEPQAGQFNVEKQNAKFDEKINERDVIDSFNTYDEYKEFENKISGFYTSRLYSKETENTNKMYINLDIDEDEV